MPESVNYLSSNGRRGKEGKKRKSDPVPRSIKTIGYRLHFLADYTRLFVRTVLLLAENDGPLGK